MEGGREGGREEGRAGGTYLPEMRDGLLELSTSVLLGLGATRRELRGREGGRDGV